MRDDPNELDPTELPSTEAVPSRSDEHQQIGPYHLLQKLGEGGMGEVWLAEQTEPVKRRVALKIIKQGMDTRQVVARFEAERQALAIMDHPAVAKVFDAGTTPHGRPYFVMEYVKGVPITEHCDRHKLTNRERLKLFMQVCEGVQHAHQKAIIHRDLKPSNVLVTEQDGKRLPKIIDFGVAKATAQKLTDKTVYTELGVLIGTPEYMSPEQAELTGEDVDTRTDVYSLGVVLYELLVGALPFDSKELRSGGYEGIRKKIREEEPHKPSTRLSTLGDKSTESAKCRRVDLPTLQRQLRGDLDWITMRALEKDRSRRYGSPMEFAADIGRYLADEPVLASPPSGAYRARKFVRRHRIGVAATGLALGVLIAFVVTTSVQSRRIERQSQEIAREAKTSERVSMFLADMLGNVDAQTLGIALWNDLRERVAEVRRGRGLTDDEIEVVVASLEEALSGVNPTDVALRLVDEEILSRAGTTIEQELAEEPRIAGPLANTIGVTYWKLGLYEQAERHAERAMEIRERELGQGHPETLRSMSDLANVYESQGRYDEAEALFLEILETRRRVLGDEHPETLRSMNNLGIVYKRQGRYEEAELLHHKTLEVQRRVFGDRHQETLGSMNNLANVYEGRGRYNEAKALYIEALNARRRVLGDDHPETLRSMNNLAYLHGKEDRQDEAESLYVEALEVQKRVLGDNHPDTLRSMDNLANVYENQGRNREAEVLYLDTLETRRRVRGDDHPYTLFSMDNLAKLYENLGRYGEAEPLLLETLEARRRVLGEDHQNTLFSMENLVNLYENQGRYDEAETLYPEILEARRAVLGDDDEDTLISMANLAAVYENQGRYDEAEALYRETIEVATRVLGDDDEDTPIYMDNLAAVYENQGRYDEAEALLLEMWQASKRVLGDVHWRTIVFVRSLAALYRVQGLHDEAEPYLREVLEAHKVVYGEQDELTLDSMYGLGCLEALRGNRTKAMEWLRSAVAGGYSEADTMRDDADLESLHGPEFDVLVKLARQNAAAQQKD